jgi:hypothetical protein
MMISKTLLSRTRRNACITICSNNNINNNNNVRLLSLLSTRTRTRTGTMRSIHVNHYQSDEDAKNNNNNNNINKNKTNNTTTEGKSNQTITTTTTTTTTNNNNNNNDENNKSASASASASTPISTPTSTPRRASRSRRSRGGGGGGGGGCGGQKHQKQRLVDEKQIPSYKEFIHRFTVLSLYRGYLKTIRESMPHNQNDLLNEVRKEFHSNKNTIDPITVQRDIKEGQRRYDELKEFTGQSNKYEQDGTSWINTKDTDDPRGRVGTGWPWSK